MTSIIFRPAAVLLLASAMVALTGCNTMLPTAAAPPPPPSPMISFQDCNHIPVGKYSDQAGAVTIEIAKSPTNPGFKHNVRINGDPTTWNYTAACKDYNSST